MNIRIGSSTDVLTAASESAPLIGARSAKVTITVRKALTEDSPAACAALRRSIVECCHEDHGGNRAIIEAWLVNKTPETVRAWILSPGYAVVAEREGAIVGTAMLDQDGKVSLCYLLPEARFVGAGKAMLCVLEVEAQKRGQKHIELGSTKTVHDFYKRQGYTDTGKIQSAFGLSAPILTDFGDGEK